ncbi:DUF1574 domain-containing protein [Oculatella sp. LEGE 06141]|uniref:DUF1574 domain-containing protein n=1 Tax=Oculatella sp. LEGE 06141 TaxID=1828648 RepID=UPI0018812E22|nr:DUF1574 domain-containing protein [Oculatella sp. LEGE 06141]MBE9180517.1 DUF1574 domain-containing protein [Oculatella sp. LEGE 06141]
MSNAVEDHSPSNQRSPLAQWIYKTLGAWRVRIKFRLRGNNLHVLCEGASCPERKTALLQLIPALQQTNLNTLLPAHQPRIYQVLLYGRRSERSSPDWTAQIHLNQLERHLAQMQQPHPSSPALALSTAPAPPNRRSPQPLPGPSAIVVSNRSLAKRGKPEALARYLSESLSKLGVSVQVSVKTIPYLDNSVTLPSQTPLPELNPGHPKSRRLWITCEATYSPDPSLISETIAHQLRDLELEGYRDAITLVQVAGETKPDWVLRVDLTPTKEMLREWVRWGDVEAIERLLNLELAPANARLATVSLKDSTLHLSCSQLQPSSPAAAPEQHAVRAIVAPLLETLGPQGIHAATVYGQVAGQPTPQWIDWLDLPASVHAALATPMRTLAQQRDWGAIAFLLNRLLNPDIDQQLATGGIRLQILPKQDLLHIMADAPICPEQRRVGPAIAQFLQELDIPNLAGVRVYGRRAGQKRPLWSYGADFASRNRLVPEATPEFAATDAYIGDLIAPSEEVIIRPDLTPADLQTAWTTLQHQLVHHAQRILVRSQLFTLSSDVQDRSVSAPGQAGYQTAKAVAIWGAVGLLLMIQADWVLGQWLQQPQSPPTASAVVPTAVSPSPSVSSDEAEIDLSFPDISLNRSAEEDSSVFDSSGFTQPGQATNSLSASPQTVAVAPAAHSTAAPASFTPISQIPAPTTPVATVTADDSPYPTFNSRQLDEKIALYYQFLEQSGPPDVLIIGSSRALRGVDPAVLKQALAGIGYTDLTIFNFGVNGATAQVVDLILRELLTPEQLPRLVIWADGARAFNSGGVDVTYNGIAASEGYQQIADGTIPLHSVTPAAPMSGITEQSGQSASGGIGSSLASGYRAIDRWLSDRLAAISTAYQERDRLKTLFQQTVTALLPAQKESATTASVSATDETATSLPQEGQGMIDFEGFLPLSVQFNPATYYQQYARVAGAYDGDYKDFQIEGNQATALRSLLALTQSRNIPVVFVNSPLTQQYLDDVRSQHEQEFKQYMLNLAVQQPGFIFRDLGELWLDQYDYFSDPSHLNRYGAYEVSNRLAQDPMIPWPSPRTKTP